MKLYFDPISTSSRPVTFLLHDQGIPFEEAPMGLFLGEQHEAGFLKLNPMGQLPLLDDEGFLLPESNAIKGKRGDERRARATQSDRELRSASDSSIRSASSTRSSLPKCCHS